MSLLFANLQFKSKPSTMNCSLFSFHTILGNNNPCNGHISVLFSSNNEEQAMWFCHWTGIVDFVVSLLHSTSKL